MNFSISEVIVILLIALIVIKPEQLPGTALTLGRLVRTVRGYFNKMKNEVTGLIDSVEKSDEPKREQQP